jgi:hypothetical protein
MPKRLLKVKRIYALGNYQNIEMTDEISDLDTTTMPPDSAYKLNLLQILGMEKLFFKYLSLRGKIADNRPEEAIEELDKMRLETLTELKDALPSDAEHTLKIEKGE